MGQVFGRKRKTTRTADVLVAIVQHRPVVAERTSPERLVKALQASVAHVHAAVADTEGTVLRFIGNVTVAAWVCDPAGATEDPLGLARRLVSAARASVAVRGPEEPCLGRVLVGLARSPCVIEEQRGRLVSAMGHAVIRAYHFPAVPSARDADVIALDSTLRDVLPPGLWHDDGDGVCLVPVETA